MITTRVTADYLVISQCIQAARRVSTCGRLSIQTLSAKSWLELPFDRGLTRLISREPGIIGLVADGRSHQAMADALHLAIRSVEKHVTSIFIKLDLSAAATDHRRVLAVFPVHRCRR